MNLGWTGTKAIFTSCSYHQREFSLLGTGNDVTPILTGGGGERSQPIN